MYFGSFDMSKRDLTRRNDGFDDASELNKKMKATEDDLIQTKDDGGTAINVQSKYKLRAPPGSLMEFVSHTQVNCWSSSYHNRLFNNFSQFVDVYLKYA